MDPLILSRIQFAANISFHILFPTITIALGWVLLFFKLRFNRTGDEKWMDAYRFWVKVFALSFALGVVSGITMSFQFGTNWPGFMERVGNIAGPLLAYEVLTAFFLEAAFLGIMLFGFRRVPGWLHTTATSLVAFGTTLSAFWILVLNSWMHTPDGYALIDGVVHATDWMAIIFNPSLPYRLTHMLLASGLTVAFLIAGVSALRWIWGDRGAEVRTTLRFGATMGALLIPLQIYAGDMHGLNTLEHQPAKVAAMEGNWETQGNVPLVLFAIPDQDARENRLEIAVPNVASLILTHSVDGEVPGLNDFVADDGTVQHPPVAPVFYSFRVMVGMGFAMLALSWSSMWFMRRGRGVEGLPRPWIYAFAAMGFSGWIATLAGWYVTEIGRQPWLVTGVLSTKDAVGPVSGGMVASSLVAYLLVYALLMAAYLGTLAYLARRAARHDPLTPDLPTPDAGVRVLQPAE
ncbi:cytochrome ubiquinol oxidase subunit I [Paracoccus sp. Ld10]|uniref:cytochrome ubiquinol oxidase subunit I n=1 Tax=Paracoccus sp. Ld10 TaxID=649158 RepID=UPI00386A6F2D